MPRALILAPRRRSMVSSMPTATGPFGTKAATSSPSRQRAAARPDQRLRLSARWSLANPAAPRRPTQLSAAATVRQPGARMAPAASASRLAQVGRVTHPANGAIQAAREPKRVSRSACLAMAGSRWRRCRRTTPRTPKGSTVPASDPMRARIEAFNRARGGGVAVQKAGRAATCCLANAPGHRWPGSSRPGEADKVQVLWWNGQRWTAPGPFGIAAMPLDAAFDHIASEPHSWINA